MLLNIPNPTIKIVHPVHGDVSIEIEKPTIADAVEFADKTSEYRKSIVATHPDTGKVIRNSVGKPEMVELPQRIPLQVTLDHVSKYVKNITGFEDQKWTPGVTDKMLRAFFEPRFFFKEERDVPLLDEQGQPTGATERREVDVNFYQHIIETMMNPGSYDDPLAPGHLSSTPVKSDSA